jgi:hypothetical protein
MSERKKWDPDRMKGAVTAIRKKEIGGFEASRVLGVPQTTRERYVNL